MSINEIITTLNKSGCNSKQQVIYMLENMIRDDLLELQRDVKERIALLCEK